MSLLRIIYISRMEFSLSEAAREVPRILEASRANNTRNGITGALLVGPDGFAQVLEGPPVSVEETFERIQCDPRHDGVSVLDILRVDTREFSEWSMAFCDGAEVLKASKTTLAHLAAKGAGSVQDTLGILRRAMVGQQERARMMVNPLGAGASACP